ncbi:transcriptional repressor [Peptacetobacter hominis]|uniref:Transcriptional repressor n=1 Tax=Peptacetobacter hominis TaxID=2743610 RepID=A0A544QXD5_9FIRM|nr:transcriptional repressor [Peptacetobacter hominis]
MTKYEKRIYNIVNNSTEHMTAEQIFDSLKKEYPTVSRATIYNNLNKLCDADMIRRISIEGLTDCYDRIIRHDHIVCKKCGKLMDKNFEDLTKTLKDQLGEDFLYYDLKVFCICEDCRNKK